MADNSQKEKFFTVKQFVQEHPWCREGGLRAQIFHGHKNGLEKAGAVIRIGRKVLIVEAQYFEWIRSQQGEEGDSDVPH